MSTRETATMRAATPRYDRVSMTFHWLTLLLLIVMFATMWAREGASDGDTAATLLTVHRSTGLVLWLLTLARLLWKATAGHAPALPSDLPVAQRWAARATQYALYALLLLQPITGFLQSIARGKSFPLIGLTMPTVMERNKDYTHLFHDIHETSATILLVLIGVHALAALFHGIVRRDGVLRAMVPIGR
jgi:cytochrome b561